ncbi:MAG: sulfatase [Pirellulales bacterium]|nr:sulfatase [Pirellulales bacterium]
MIVGGLWAIVCLAFGGLPREASAAEKNVVVIVADDLGLTLGCYGDPVARTPNIDRLAAQGTRFANAFCTTASCSPSRSVILTGLHNHANGQYGLAHAAHHFRTREELTSLPRLLSAAGYRTCSIGKVHVEPEAVYRFDTYANEGIQGGRNPVRMAENARDLIESDDERPFFLYFCPTDPHRAKQGFANDTPHPGVSAEKFDPAKISVPGFLPDEPEVREELAEYYESVARVDQGVGRLLEVLEQTGHADDTLVLFLSDNGMPWPGAKTTLYEPGMHLPLIVRDPAQKKRGVVTRALVSWTDLTPTILDYAGAEGPKYPLHGRSFRPVLDQEEPAGWDEVFGSHTFHEVTMYYPMRVLRTPRYKCLLNLAHTLPFPFASDLYGSPTWQGVLARGDQKYGRRLVADYVMRPRLELYDLESDPGELENLAERPEHQQTLAQLTGRLRQWQESTRDPWLIKYEHE